MSTAYRMERTVAGPEWDAFVLNSEYGALFSYSTYLKALKGRHGLYFVYNNKELRAAVAVVESEDGRDAVLNDFVIYNGIIFAPPANRQNRAQRISEQFRITEFVAEELHRIYRNIELALSPSFADIRPFLWVNYGTDRPQYRPDVRYTSCLDISDFSTSSQLNDIGAYLNASKARRQEIRYSRREGVETVEDFDTAGFVKLYTDTMGRQEVTVAREKSAEMNSLLVTLQEEGLGRMFISRTRDGRIGSMACFGIDHCRAYYLFGANDPKLRNYHTGTAVLWDAFYVLNAAGIKEVDLEGVNSPNRGWFKLSFGGDLRPYYELSLKKP